MGRFFQASLTSVIFGIISGFSVGTFSVFGNRFMQRFEEVSEVGFNLRKLKQLKSEEEEKLLGQFKKKHPNDDY